MSSLRLLQVEDSPDDAELVVAELELAGFAVEARRVDDAQGMAAALAEGTWDAVISDYSLPVFSTEAALALIKERDLDLPFIVVSGCVGDETAAALMRAGAHDFIVKDNLSRLAPAVERELREAAMRRDRKLDRQRIEKSERLLRDITSAIGEGILVQDRHGRLMFMNPEAERLLGWSEAELMQRDVHDCIHCRRSDGTPYPRGSCPVQGLVTSGSLYRSEDEVFVRRDGTAFPVSYVATPLMEEGRMVASVTAFQDITERKQAELELRESRRHLRELSAFLENVREAERTHIARELHDELGQQLTALRIDLDWLDAKLPEREERVAVKLATMREQVAKTVESVRRIAQDLRPGVLDDLGLAAAIEWHAEQFEGHTGITCLVRMNREEFELRDQVATAVFRIVQEALTNVARHADATRAVVSVKETGDGIRLEVSDNGKGLAPESGQGKKSYGLLGIRERVNMLGGNVTISGPEGQGVTVRAWIPFEGTGRMQ